MKTFDFETAWHELAKPAFDRLPERVRELYARVIVETGHLSQLKNCNMPWPTYEGVRDPATLPDLRVAFDAIPADELAMAARVIHNYGHWRPSGVGVNPDKVGGHWRFSNYADQSLAHRLHHEESTGYSSFDRGVDHKGYGISHQVLEGFIRVQLNSPGSWTWHEICPATRENWEKLTALEHAHVVSAHIRAREWRLAESGFDAFCNDLRNGLGLSTGAVWVWLDISPYMVEEEAIKQRKAREVAADPNRLEKARARVIERFDDVIRKAEIEKAGYLWLIDHGIGTDNVIYYDHRGVWCLGWSQPLSADIVEELTAKLAEFPYKFEFKTGVKA